MTERPSRPLRIVIVDDNEVIVDLLKMVFERRGHEVRTFGSPEDALADAADMIWGGCDLAIVDLMMPRVKGTAVLQMLRDKYPGVVRLVFTAMSPPDLADLNLAHETLLKPSNVDLLTETVEGAYDRWSSHLA